MFAEQIEGLTVKHAHRTSCAAPILERIGLALADRARSRVAIRLGLIVAGRNTLLRLMHALPDPEVGAATVLGVEDITTRRAASTRL